MRRAVKWAVIGVLFGGMTFGAKVTIEADPLGPRVRSTNAVIAAALVEAQSRSPTFRSLIGQIEKTDGIVYVERGRCGHGVPACLSLSIVSGSGYRLLRILVDSVDNLMSLVATIGHELRHAIELLADPQVRTTTAAYYFYQREAPTNLDAFETAAAIRTGLEVEREFRR